MMYKDLLSTTHTKMRSLSRWDALCIFIVTLLLIDLEMQTSEASMLDDTVKLANIAGRKLVELAEQTTGRKDFEEVFAKLLQNKTIKIYEVDGMKVVKKFADSLAAQVESKNSVLLKVKHKAEEYYRPPDQKIKPFTFFDMKDYNYSGRPVLKRDPKFFSSKPVNTSISSYHIPTNVYRFKSDVLNVIKQRQKLDKLYEENYRNMSTLLWQYIGSHSGVLSMYPGYIWPNPETDRFDCRRRGWYTIGASSSKDVVILLDRSGSMVGTNFNIATAAANIIVESLQENDFFNIVHFNSDAKVVNNCYPKLVQATKSNREALRSSMSKLAEPSGFANGVKALEMAYNLLKEAGKSELTSSGCHQVIFLLSDEIEDFQGTKKVIEHHKDMKVRIFGYKIGRGHKKSDALKYISCKTLGKFYELETIGNAYDFVLDYVRILGSPIALAGDKLSTTPVYVPIYVDWETQLLVTSVVLPVVNNTAPSGLGLLGVAGQDITMIELANTVPRHELGFHGYGFSINNNGFVLFHHRLKTQKDRQSFSPTTVLSALEFNVKNASDVLMKKMIDRENGSLNTSTFLLNPVLKQERVIEAKVAYFFTAVRHTPLSAGIAISEFGQKQISVANYTSIDYFTALKCFNSTDNLTKMTIFRWPYCNITSKKQANSPTIKKIYPDKEELLEYLQKFNDTPKKCDKKLVSDLLLSAKVVHGVITKAWNRTRNKLNKIISTFVSTHAGFTRVQSTEPNITAGQLQNLDISDSIFLRAAEIYKEPNINYVFDSMENTGKTKDEAVVVVAPIVVGNESAIAGVVGFTIWQNVTFDMIVNANAKTSYKFVDCRNYRISGCYVMDTDGYIIVSNKDKQLVNRFFGMSEGLVMRQLIKQSIFNKYKFKDEQAECSPLNSSSGSASIISNAIIGCVYCLFQSLLTVLSTVMLGLIWKSNENNVQAQSATSSLVNCVQEMTFYKLNTTKLPYADATKDYICRKNFSLAVIPGTNLVLVVTDRRNSACNSKDWTLSRVPIKLPDKCENKYRYRRKLNTCAKNHPQEKQHCSSKASTIRTNQSTLLVGLLITRLLLFNYRTNWLLHVQS